MGDDAFDRVVWQHFGGAGVDAPKAGGVYRFAYERVIDQDPAAEPANTPQSRVEVVDRSGGRTVRR